MFKYEFESMEFENMKNICKKKRLFYLCFALGLKPSHWPSQLPLSLSAVRPDIGPSADLASLAPYWIPSAPTRPDLAD
jgi:hypothetical protein